MRRSALRIALLGAVAALCGSAPAIAARSGAHIATAPAYCNISKNPSAAWAFRVNAPIVAATGTYAHGNGTLDGTAVSGVVCQVDRVTGAPDRQIILSVQSPDVAHVGRTTYQGHLANRLVLHIKVKSSTDRKCIKGTVGTLTLIATYNGVKDDEVQFTFPAACSDHDHTYTGPSVVALVPV